MILIFLLILGLLAFAILAEVDEDRQIPNTVAGRCPHCQNEVEGDWILCPRCRSLLKNTCDRCGKPSAVYHAFCPNCGIRHNGGEDES
jgi:predicted amidophosphoribosyltransferase